MMPTLGAVEAFLVIYNALPFSVKAFIDLSLVFSFVAAALSIIRHS